MYGYVFIKKSRNDLGRQYFKNIGVEKIKVIVMLAGKLVSSSRTVSHSKKSLRSFFTEASYVVAK